MSRVDALAPSLPLTRPESLASSRQRGTPRLARYFVDKGWAHLLLLTGAAIFLFPFVWMLATSFKTDEEIAEGGWWPTVPHFRASSPYARRPVEVRKPADVDPDHWNRALPLLQKATLESLDALPANQLQLSPTGAADYRDAAASVLLNRLTPRLGRKLWAGDPSALVAAYAVLLTPDTLAG